MNNNKKCGTCNSCCYVFPIKNTTLADGSPFPDKEGYELCSFYKLGKCSVYDNRPAICRSYKCGWMASTDRDMPNNTRPDKAGFILSTLTYSNDSIAGFLLYEVKHGRMERAKRKLKSLLRLWKDSGLNVGVIRHKKNVIDYISGDRSLFDNSDIIIKSS